MSQTLQSAGIPTLTMCQLKNHALVRLLLLLLLLFCWYSRTINGQCLTGLENSTKSTDALASFDSLLEQKFHANSAFLGSSTEETIHLLVLQFIHQSLDKLINKQTQLEWTSDPDTELWNKLMQHEDPESLVDLLACMDQFATYPRRQCRHLAALSDLYTDTRGTSGQITW